MFLSQDVYRARREYLLRTLAEGDCLVLGTAPVAIRNATTEHEYRQDSDFYYLSGFAEPESVLVLSRAHGEHRYVLFVRPRDPERETWDGRRAGVEGATTRYGADAAFSITELASKLPEYLKNTKRVHCRFGRESTFDAKLIAAINQVRATARSGAGIPSQLVDVSETLHEMRLHKTPDEVALMKRALAITGEAHRAAMQVARPGVFEYAVDAELTRVFRSRGSERAAYGSIVGAGINATILHYRENNALLRDGDLLLIDAGCELDYYASDITRTFPVSGRFSPEQRAVYEVVLDAQLQAIDAVKPGATLDGIHDVAVRALTAGMVKLGLLAGEVDELITANAYRAFYMHRTSHWLGMDVHDAGVYYQNQKARPLEPGMVLTVEPGLYVGESAPAEARWKGIGVRIEDDVLVTAQGFEVLSADIPKGAAEIEALLAARAA